MRAGYRPLLATALTGALAISCASPDRRTVADLRRVEPDMTEVTVDEGLERAMRGYQSFLEQAPDSSLTPEAMRRLADLKLEKEYGYLGASTPAATQPPSRSAAALEERPAPPARLADATAQAGVRTKAGVTTTAGGTTRAGVTTKAANATPETDGEFEHRAAAAENIAPALARGDIELPGEDKLEWAGPLEAIELYDRILETYPGYEHNDRVLYQKARAYDELGRTDEAIAVMQGLLQRYPSSRWADEAQFRRGEYFFTRKRFLEAEEAYAFITALGASSSYYELALYKLGWTFYKQELHDEALDQYVTLLDQKVSTGYDFDQSENEDDERRIADTFRVISLSFSSLGGPEAVESYFVQNGERVYEDRIYRQLGEFYLEKLRYHDAAVVYEAFIELHPLHRVSPRFSMRVVEIYEAGGFPKLVLESKREFASRYGLDSEYWRHYDVEGAPEVLANLRTNLEDLAGHYHAVYQESEDDAAKPESFQEALRWYRAFLTSFPADPTTPAIHYRLADLLLEGEAFDEAASEYERTAYAYGAHERSAAAGYAAIYAHREDEKRAREDERSGVTRRTVASTLRFVETFPAHEHAAVVLGAAVDDLYDLGELEPALATAQRLLDQYGQAQTAVRRSAWAVVANASLDLARYEAAEQAYTRVLELTTEEDASRQAVVDSLAAAIYKQGEQAVASQDDRAAADHFLRITRAAPASEIRGVAEYDAAAALIRLADWKAAETVLAAFRTAHPDHALQKQVTQQMAFVFREQGDDGRAASEYERVADEAQDEALARDALLLAGELHEKSGGLAAAITVYQRYVDEFAEPLEDAVETRFKIAKIHQKSDDEERYHATLREIVRIDERAGSARTPRIRTLAGRGALTLTEDLYEGFRGVQLVQPFDRSLKKKRALMDDALEGFEALVEYEVAEVTAGATFYIAEIYRELSRSLMESERPAGLSSGQLNDYELALEEEAFPFEEQAIEVHEKNLELISVGVFNGWIEKSLGQLAALMPGRYAKFEASSGLIASIDHYAYRAPRTVPEEPVEDPAADPMEDPAVEPAAPPPVAAPALQHPPAHQALEVSHE